MCISRTRHALFNGNSEKIDWAKGERLAFGPSLFIDDVLLT